ncbi:MAG: putative oxidoreductase C-terminal domain-containing protein [Gemmataceae bacterium]
MASVLRPANRCGRHRGCPGRAAGQPRCRAPDYQRVTGEPDFPADLAGQVRDGVLLYHGNTALSYKLRGAHVRLSVLWGFEPGPGQGDRHLARLRGTRSAIDIRQGAAERHRPEVYVVPRDAADLPALRPAVSTGWRRFRALPGRRFRGGRRSAATDRPRSPPRRPRGASPR